MKQTSRPVQDTNDLAFEARTLATNSPQRLLRGASTALRELSKQRTQRRATRAETPTTLQRNWRGFNKPRALRHQSLQRGT